jgi:hypothetical protein
MFYEFYVSERTQVTPLPRIAIQIDKIFLRITGLDTKENLLRYVITVVYFGWNSLVLDEGVAVSWIIIRWDINSEFYFCQC